MVVFRRPSDGKVSLFLEDPELGAIVISIRNLVPPFGVTFFSFMEGGMKIHLFSDSGRFLPIMLGEDGSYFEKGDLFFPLRKNLPNRNVTKRTSLFFRG